jgi:hypothetical protein
MMVSSPGQRLTAEARLFIGFKNAITSRLDSPSGPQANPASGDKKDGRETSRLSCQDGWKGHLFE